MPSKRSKSQERVRKMNARAKMSEEDKERVNASRRMLRAKNSEEEKEKSVYMGYKEELRRNKERIRKSRANKSEEEKNEELRKNRERILKLRANKSEEEWKADCEADRERNERESEKKDTLVKEFEKIYSKHQKRDKRSKRSGKEKLLENLNSKKGMSLFRGEGRLKQLKERDKKNTDQTMDWKNFMKKSKHHADMTTKFKPDIVQKVNEIYREEKEQMRRQTQKEQEDERRRKVKVLEDGGEWVYNPEYSEYFWVGEGEPVVDHQPEFKPLSEKALKKIQEQEEKWLQANIDERKREAKEKRRKKYEEMKML